MKSLNLFLKIKKNKVVLFVVFCILYISIFYYWVTEVYPNSTNILKKLPNFLTHDECDKIINLSKDYLEESKVYQKYENQGKTDLSHRKSKQTFLNDNVDPLIKSITEKCSSILNLPSKNAEQLQVVKYDKNDFFNEHYDALCDDDETNTNDDNCSNDRYATILVYLNDGFIGGETEFPKLNISVIPKKGDAILFYNKTWLTRKIFTKSLHSGKPIKEGTKWICNKWYRFEGFDG